MDKKKNFDKEEFSKRKTSLKVWDGEAGLVYESQLQAWEEYPAKTTKQVLKWYPAKIIPNQNYTQPKPANMYWNYDMNKYITGQGHKM